MGGKVRARRLFETSLLYVKFSAKRRLHYSIHVVPEPQPRLISNRAAVRALGACFMAAGIAASLTLPEWGNIWLGIGFGGLHVGFGAYIARYHGG